MRRWSSEFGGTDRPGHDGSGDAPATVGGGCRRRAWVSKWRPVSAPGNSCTHPGYSTIQSAINAVAPGAVIHICAGTYTEQLTITRVLVADRSGAVTVKLPTSPVNSTTTCDNAIGAVSQQPQDAVSICGAGTVSITGITVSAFWPAGFCYDSLYGIFVGQGSNLVSNKLAVDGAGVPVGDSAVGCQGGVAIQVGSARPTPTRPPLRPSRTPPSRLPEERDQRHGNRCLHHREQSHRHRTRPCGHCRERHRSGLRSQGHHHHATVSNNCVLPGRAAPTGSPTPRLRRAPVRGGTGQ